MIQNPGTGRLVIEGWKIYSPQESFEQSMVICSRSHPTKAQSQDQQDPEQIDQSRASNPLEGFCLASIPVWVLTVAGWGAKTGSEL